MNAIEISPQASARLNRINKISRVLKVLLLPFLLCLVWSGYFLPFVHRMPDGLGVVGGTYTTFSDAPLAAKLIVMLAVGLFSAAGITCYQLLTLYEKGVIFSARNVQLLSRVGYLALSYGLLKVGGQMAISTWEAWVGTFGSPLNAVLWGIPALFSSPWIIGGLFVVVISRIMDEGRKIQEEQALTV